MYALLDVVCGCCIWQLSTLQGPAYALSTLHSPAYALRCVLKGGLVLVCGDPCLWCVWSLCVGHYTMHCKAMCGWWVLVAMCWC